MKSIRDMRIYWNDIKNCLRESVEASLFIMFDEIAVFLQQTDEDYVYVFDYEYGVNVYEDGKFKLPENCDLGLRNDFYSEIEYNTFDPLGIVLENYIEVYETVIEDSKNYYYPVNRIKEGEIFGTFGISDYVCNSVSDKLYSWNISSGTRSIIAMVPKFSNERKSKQNEAFAKIIGLENTFKRELYERDDYLLVKHVFNKCIGKQWKSKVLVFPKHWITGTNEILKKLHLQIMKIAWEQSRHTRLSKLSHQGYNKYKYISGIDRLKLYPILEYLRRIINGDAYVLKRIDSSDESMFHEVSDYLQREIMSLNNRVLQQNYPIILKYNLLSDTEHDWCIFSLAQPQFFGHITDGRSDDNIRLIRDRIKKEKNFDNGKTIQFFMGYNNIIINDQYLSFDKEEDNTVDTLLQIPNNRKIPLKKIPLFKSFLIIRNRK